MKLGSLPSGLLVVETSFSTESLMEKFSLRQNKAELRLASWENLSMILLLSVLQVPHLLNERIELDNDL